MEVLQDPCQLRALKIAPIFHQSSPVHSSTADLEACGNSVLKAFSVITKNQFAQKMSGMFTQTFPLYIHLFVAVSLFLSFRFGSDNHFLHVERGHHFRSTAALCFISMFSADVIRG